MGFLETTPTITLIAKLTPFGRQQLLTNSNTIITQFSLGDSDANYLADLPLDNGRVPDISGEIGPLGSFNNGVYSGANIKSTIRVDATGATKKLIQAGSSAVVISPLANGLTTVTGNTITQLIIDRTSGATDGNVNLFKTFGLPITTANKDLYTNFVSPTGYLDTAIRNFNQDKIVVLGIEACDYGEILDGKTVKIELATMSGATVPDYTIYSTFQKSLTPLTTVDSQLKELLNLGSAMGNNVALLFCDDVQRPNNTATKSWATGYGLSKPFSSSGKELYNSLTVSSTATVVDSAIGIAYLDRGIIVLTHPDIVDNFDVNGTGNTITFDSVSNEVAQNITCIVERDEFSISNNSTYTSGDLIRVSEVALYDNSNNVIAIAKSNEQIIIGANQFMALGVRILV